MKPIVALDFDGVICDSIDECMLSAFNAYHFLDGGSKWVDSLFKINPEFSRRFRFLRYLVRPAKEYWLLVNWIYKHDDNIDQSKFDILKKEYADHLVEFEPLFFEARHRLRVENPAGWLALHRLYPEFLQGWDKVRNHSSVYIVTDKDLLSVQYVIQLWGLSIAKEHLWTKEKRLSKSFAIDQISMQTDCPPRNILFVDDNPHYLSEVSMVGARCFWASWGYSNFETAQKVDEFPHLATLAELPL